MAPSAAPVWAVFRLVGLAILPPNGDWLQDGACRISRVFNARGFACVFSLEMGFVNRVPSSQGEDLNSCAEATNKHSQTEFIEERYPIATRLNPAPAAGSLAAPAARASPLPLRMRRRPRALHVGGASYTYKSINQIFI